MLRFFRCSSVHKALFFPDKYSCLRNTEFKIFFKYFLREITYNFTKRKIFSHFQYHFVYDVDQNSLWRSNTVYTSESRKRNITKNIYNSQYFTWWKTERIIFLSSILSEQSEPTYCEISICFRCCFYVLMYS